MKKYSNCLYKVLHARRPPLESSTETGYLGALISSETLKKQTDIHWKWETEKTGVI